MANDRALPQKLRHYRLKVEPHPLDEAIRVLRQKQVEEQAAVDAGSSPPNDSAKWSGWHPPGEWWKNFPKSESWCRSKMTKWLTEGTVQRKGERGDIRFLLSFLKELEIEPPS